MQEQIHQKFHKTVIINRAVSGSGKTTLSRLITNALREKGLTIGVHSTDEFFMQGNRYVFDIEKLNAYHKKNLSNFIADLEKGIDIVICDNMNLLPWQSQPYTNAARKYNYRILFLNFLPRELAKHISAQIVTPEKPDAHGLSKELLERFIKDFNDYNDLLDKNTVRDIKRHRVFVWNDIDNTAMDTGELSQYFDSDNVITIRPEEYQQLKTTIHEKVLDIITKPNNIIQKKYLLTWYGMTDLRASLGFDATEGPVLSALRTGKYSDVVILGYTNPNKKEDSFSENMKNEWEILRTKSLDERLAYPREKMQTIVDAVSNVNIGHEIYCNFIESANLPVKIHFIPHELSHLNDVIGITEASTRALQVPLSDSSEKSITCFISPGTPLMAYSWATLSNRNPNLKIRIITTSDSRRLPEEIELPKDIYTPDLVDNNFITNYNFDVVIHLLGTDTNIPQYFTILQFPTKNHYFITTSESKKLEALISLCPEDTSIETRLVDSFNIEHSRKVVEEIVCSLPSTTRIGLNLTGGTKLMFAGALNACNKFVNIEPFYFDIKQHNFTFLRTNEVVPFEGITNVDGFFKANGFDILEQGKWDDNPIREQRKKITLKIWENKNRELLGNFYKSNEFKKYKADLDKALKKGRAEPEWDVKFNSKLEIEYKNNNVSLNIYGEKFYIQNCRDFGRYISGGWLEEYAFIKFSELLKDGEIFDLRIGMKVAVNNMEFAELDGVFTDGKRLYIVECKAGAVRQECIQKLENNLKLYGGIAAQGCLFTSFPPTDNITKNRIGISTSIKRQDETIKILRKRYF